MISEEKIKKRNRRKPIQSVERAIRILNTLTEPMTLTELTSILRLNKTTTYNLLSTLMKYNFVHQLSKTKKYVLGYGLAHLHVAQKYVSIIQMIKLFKNDLHKLMSDLQETAHLAVLVENNVVIIDSVVCDRSFTVNPRINEPVPTYCTSVGKAILANLPDEEWKTIVEKEGFRQYTKNTITNIERLTHEIIKIRSQGFALDDEEYEEGVRCVGAPLFIRKKGIIAAVAATGPAIRLPDDKIIQMSKIVVKCVEACKQKAFSWNNLREWYES